MDCCPRICRSSARPSITSGCGAICTALSRRCGRSAACCGRCWGSVRRGACRRGSLRERAEAQFADALMFIAEQADRNGLDLVLDPLNRAETNLLITLDECRKFLADQGLADVPAAGRQLPPAGRGAASAVEACGPLIGHALIAEWE